LCREDEYPIPHEVQIRRRDSEEEVKKERPERRRAEVALDVRRLQLETAPAVVWDEREKRRKSPPG